MKNSFEADKYEAIILAAGFGSRLMPLTSEIPKALVKVNNIPILKYQIDSYIEAGVKNIIIVVGYKSEILSEYINREFNPNSIKFQLVINNEYATTNNMYSLYLAMNLLRSDRFLLSNGDIIFERDMVTHIVNNPAPAGIAYESNNYNEESMKIIIKDGKICTISKKVQKKEATGVSIDFYKFDSKAKGLIKDEINYFIEGRKDLNSWTEAALNNILGKVKFSGIDIEDRFWYEIDTLEDLINAENVIIKYK